MYFIGYYLSISTRRFVSTSLIMRQTSIKGFARVMIENYPQQITSAASMYKCLAIPKGVFRSHNAKMGRQDTDQQDKQ